MGKVSIPCSECSEPIAAGDDFCQGCGHALTAVERRAIEERLVASNASTAGHVKRVREASTAILVVAVLFVLGGIVYFFVAQGQADDALTSLSGLPDDAIVPQPLRGETVTVAELRDAVRAEPYQLLGVNLLLAVTMGALYLWARKNPLPAIISALIVFVMVHVVNAVADPATIAQGIIVKIFAVVVLAKGVKAALAAHAAGVVGAAR